MELIIPKHFAGEAFFHTAIGVYFEFDIQAQFEIWDLVLKHGIKQIVFATAINNVFYKDACKRYPAHNYSVTKVLTQTRKSISHDHKSGDELFPNFHLLAAQHLANQKNRLMSSSYIGAQLKQVRIEVSALVYHPQRQSFSSLHATEVRGKLLNIASCN